MANICGALKKDLEKLKQLQDHDIMTANQEIACMFDDQALTDAIYKASFESFMRSLTDMSDPEKKKEYDRALHSLNQQFPGL